MLKSRLLKTSILTLSTLLIVSPSFAFPHSLNKSQEKVVTELFKALASSNPDKISVAQKKYVSSNSPAFKFVDLIKNHHSTVRYFKSINSFGMPSGVTPTPEIAGTYKVTSAGVDFNSIVNEFDSFNYKFMFDSKGKIKSWSMQDRSKKNGKKLETRINGISSNFNQNGISITSGYIFKQTDNDTFLQLLIKNTSSNLKSWSYAGGKYGDSKANYFDAETYPVGCLYPGQSAYFEAAVIGSPEIVAKTNAAFEAPTFNGCGDGSVKSRTSFIFTIE